MTRSVLVLATLVAVAGCAAVQNISKSSGVKPPEMHFETVSYRAVDFNALHCDVSFAVKNPNRIGGRVESYYVKLLVDGVTIADGNVEKVLDLAPGGTATLVIPVVVPWTELVSRLTSQAKMPDDLPWKLSGSAHVKVGKQQVALPFEREGAMPVLRPPSITPVALRVSNASLASVHIEVDFEMRSNGGHPLTIGELQHDVSFGGQEVLKGTLSPPGPVFGSAVRTVSADLSTVQAGLALVRALQGSESLPVRFRGYANVDTGYGVVPFPFDASAKLDPR